MRAYTKSKLARDAGVSAHVIRDYELRGLLSPCNYTDSGYRVYDRKVLQRLRFIVAGKAAGISLDELAALCQAIDAGDPVAARKCLECIQDSLNRYRKAMSRFRRQLNCLRFSNGEPRSAGHHAMSTN